MEQKREPRPVKKSLTSTTTMPQFKPSSESTQVVTTILDEQKVEFLFKQNKNIRYMVPE